MQTDLIAPRGDGWGLSASTLNGLSFRAASLLCPVWLPLIVSYVAGPQPGGEWIGLALLLALFVFMPGTLVVANIRGWGKPARAIAAIAYVITSEAVMLLLLRGVSSQWGH
jgi:hypothetical protein